MEKRNIYKILGLAFIGLIVSAGLAAANTTQTTNELPDHDNDGIPNIEDEDYERPLDGTGLAKGQPVKESNQGFRRGKPEEVRDADNDGVPNGQDDDYQVPEDGSNSPWISEDQRLEMIQNRFQLTDEQVNEIQNEVQTMIKNGEEPQTIRAQIQTKLEEYGVEEPNLGIGNGQNQPSNLYVNRKGAGQNQGQGQGQGQGMGNGNRYEDCPYQE